jgi:AraC-like DNA-binding protein
MAVVLDTSAVAVRDRPELVRETIHRTILSVEIGWADEDATVACRGIISDLGRLQVCSIRSTATGVERTAAQAQDASEPCIFLGLQATGSSMVVQGDRGAVLTPGRLVIYDSTAPYTLITDGGVNQDFFRVPHSVLGLPHDLIRQACAVSLCEGHPIAALTATYLSKLAALPNLLTAPNAEALGHPSIELIRAVIATHLNAEQLTREPMHESLPHRILEYARAHLGDADLSAERIAAEHYISVRYLYKILAEQGISLANWIRRHRLEACRHELSRTTAQQVPIAAVARRWGFSDTSSFSRSFRAEYGMSPREWRDRCHNEDSSDPSP